MCKPEPSSDAMLARLPLGICVRQIVRAIAGDERVWLLGWLVSFVQTQLYDQLAQCSKTDSHSGETRGDETQRAFRHCNWA